MLANEARYAVPPRSNNNTGYRLCLWSLVIAICVLSFRAHCQDSTSSVPQQRSASLASATDQKVIAALQSRIAGESDAAIDEVRRRGEKMIPLLLACKGDHRRFTGNNLIGESGNSFYWEYDGRDDPSVPAELRYHVVSVEVAALYLISAIYFGDKHFASEPFLTGGPTGASSNLPDWVDAAWRSVQTWEAQRQQLGMEELKRRGQDPLYDSNYRFPVLPQAKGTDVK